MMTLQEQRLAMFVDRVAEMGRFRELIEHDAKPIMVVWGDSGIGKSSLLARMVHECATRNLRKCEVVRTDTRNHNYLGVMRKIRDDVGVDAFLSFTDLINFFTVPQYQLKIVYEGPANISVAHGLQARNSSIGDVGGIIVKDVMLNAPRSDMAVPEAERIARLTDLFIESLGAVAGDQPLIVFFDAIEKMTPETERWVCDELLGAACGGRLKNVRLVLFGQKLPDFGEYRMLVEESELKAIGREHVLEYLEKRGVEASEREVFAKCLEALEAVKLSDIANYTERFLKVQKKRSAGG